jgi:pimeloyl-ACP methyl ester carboxylesterase
MPPVLLLHGIGRSLEDWALQYPRLAGAHRIIALDLPGFGFSAAHPNRPRSRCSRAECSTPSTFWASGARCA